MHPIKQKALDLGVDGVAFLNLRDYSSPRSPDPRNYLTSAMSLVLYFVRELPGGYMNQSIIRMHSLGGADYADYYIGYNLARFIEDKYLEETITMPGHRPFEINEDSWKSIIGPISLRHAASQCGFGILGRNGVVVNPTWGSMIRIGAVLTSFNLDSDKPIDFRPCVSCNYPCDKMCPVSAIQFENGQTIVDQPKCTKYSQPYDVGNFTRFLLKLVEADKKKKIEMLLTPHWFNLFMASMGYMYYGCIECTRGCPGTRLKKEYASLEPKRRTATRLSDILQ
jgi:epoxyqueuosine reductase QueG